MHRVLVLGGVLGLLACGDDRSHAASEPECELLDPDACAISFACEPFMGRDVTSADATGAACYDTSAGASEPTFLGCFERPQAGSPIVSYAYDASTERCFEVPDTARIPPGWPACDGVMPMCR